MTAKPAAPFHLPDPAHAARVPAHVAAADLARVARAAYTLPQVVTPADFGAASDEALDRMGLVLLQKSAHGARPSRWIDPALFDAAVAHLQAVGSGTGARPLLVERGSALQALGITRQGAAWTRLTRHALALPPPPEDARVPVLFRAPLPDAPIWEYFRSGDVAALHTALGPPGPYPHAAELKAHLAALWARAGAARGLQTASLLPRLQSECALPRPLHELKAACTRAFDRWERAAAETEALAGLNTELAFGGYPGTFVQARRLDRRVTIYAGPPNSGKTHAAFERLAQAIDGAYLAPLRLLALEGRDRLLGRGVPCSLLTGEENVPAEGARVVSSTIEMVSTRRTVDVAVVDEAQMLFDESRGWAWTQAIVGVPARELIVICSAYAVPAVEKLLGLCGERCSVRMFQRMQQVQPLARPVSLAALALGDAVVAFSRRDVLQLRDRIAAGGHPVSVIYGALPPEVRRREAERYATGESHVLVATDAIGMGLNLPIRRVLFSTLGKFDGVGDRELSISEVHQIAGRAGRYGLHEEGHAGVLDTAEPGATARLRELLARTPPTPEGFKAPVAPNAWHVDTIAARLGRDRLRDVLDVFVAQLRLDDAHFAVAELNQMLELAAQLDASAGKLTLQQRFVYAQAPVDTRTDTLVQEFLAWSANHAHGGRAGRPWFLEEVDGHSRLERMEQALRACTLWLWLDLRFPGVFGHVEEVHALRSSLNDGIERQLKGKKPLARLRRR